MFQRLVAFLRKQHARAVRYRHLLNRFRADHVTEHERVQPTLYNAW